jgi:hypothetical protein
MASASIDLYCSVAEKKEILKTSKRTGLSMSQLLLKGFYYLISERMNELEREAERFKDAMEAREAKERERCSGDYLGSFDKYNEKMDRLDSAKRKKRISDEEYERLKKITIEDYETTQRSNRNVLGIATKEDRKLGFAKEHGCKVGKNGKIRKAKSNA